MLAVAASQAHNLEVGGSSPSLATSSAIPLGGNSEYMYTWIACGWWDVPQDADGGRSDSVPDTHGLHFR